MSATLILSFFEENKAVKFPSVSISVNLFVDFRSWMSPSLLLESLSISTSSEALGERFQKCPQRGTRCPRPSVACLVPCWISILGCVWRFQSTHTHTKWALGSSLEKARGCFPAFSLWGSLGTVAPWLIARGKTAHNNWQKEVPMGSQVQFTCV